MSWVTGLKIAILLAIVVPLVVFLVRRRLALRQFSQEVRAEVDKVSWPSLDYVINSTILVGIVTVVLAIYCLGVDAIFASIIQAFYRR